MELRQLQKSIRDLYKRDLSLRQTKEFARMMAQGRESIEFILKVIS